MLAFIGIGIKFGIDFAVKSYFENSNLNNQQDEEVSVPDDTIINMVAIGDVMCHVSNFNAAYIQETNSYDFTPVFTNVAKYITKADIAIRQPRNNFCRY